MERIKPQPYDRLLRKALGLLTEASKFHPEKTGDMNDLTNMWHLEVPGHDSDGVLRSDYGGIMKPERWCCICERYILDTDEEVRANELVAHEACYLRAKKFFDSPNANSSEEHQCEVVVADFAYDPVFCENPANQLVDCGSGCMYWTCDEHVQAQK